MAPSNAVPSVRLLNINIFTFMNTCGAVVYRVILLHNFIQINLNSGPVKVQILLTACWRFAMALAVNATKTIHHDLHHHLLQFLYKLS